MLQVQGGEAVEKLGHVQTGQEQVGQANSEKIEYQ